MPRDNFGLVEAHRALERKTNNFLNLKSFRDSLTTFDFLKLETFIAKSIDFNISMSNCRLKAWNVFDVHAVYIILHLKNLFQSFHSVIKILRVVEMLVLSKLLQMSWNNFDEHLFEIACLICLLMVESDVLFSWHFFLFLSE